MKRVYLLMIVMGIILMPITRKMATNQRGYTAIGGEILIIPLFLLIALLVDQMVEMIIVVKNMEEKEKSQ